jgi:hypothetical protein
MIGRLEEIMARHVATVALKRYIDYYEESGRLLHLSMQGIGVLRGIPQIAESLAAIETAATQDDDGLPADYPEATKTRIERAKEHAAFAEQECSLGFPLLHSHTLVGVWGAFEAAIEDTLVDLLIHNDALLQSPAFSKVKIPLAEFEGLEKDERMRFLISEIDRTHGGGKRGVERFEILLDPFGLSGAVEPQTKNLIWEMHHVRNVIVHRAGIADRRLVTACLQMGLKVGETVKITHEALNKYSIALSNYALIIICRLGTQAGRDMQRFQLTSYDDGEISAACGPS